MQGPRVWIAAAGLLVLIPLLAVLAIFASANGPTLSALALASVPALVALLSLALPAAPSRRRRRLAAAALALVALDALYVAARLSRPAGPAVAARFCEDDDCAASPPILARVPDEQESALAGLELSRALGVARGAEADHLEALLRREYGELRASPRFSALPTAPLIASPPGHTRYLAWVPPGKERAPCLVFLHGFGGQLSVYLKVLVEELGDDFVIVAPFLDHAGRWWTPDGEAIVRDLVERRLPAAADRDRVVLVGLSNGGIGAARLVQAGPARALFRGAILLSGVADPLAADLSGVDLLVITGAADPRFPLAAVERSAELLRGRGASVSLDVLDGDHFIVLSHKRDVAAHIRAWLAPRLR